MPRLRAAQPVVQFSAQGPTTIIPRGHRRWKWLLSAFHSHCLSGGSHPSSERGRNQAGRSAPRLWPFSP